MIDSAGNRGVAGLSVADDDGFVRFYEREYDKTVRFAWLLTGSVAVAEDIVQDAMAGVYRGLGRIDSPEAYLRWSVVNLARTWARNERRQRDRISMLKQDRPQLSGADRELLASVQALPYRQRVVIVARYWGGWSEEDIARVLSCRRGTVKSLASRALDRLRKEVNQ